MPTTHVLVLSTSTASFREPDGSPSMTSALRDALTARAPEIDWRCTGELLYTTDTMRERALRLAERHRPDVIVLRPTGRSFLHDDIAGKIRIRWPRLYPLTLRIAGVLDDLSGSRAAEGSYRRRLLFTLPRRLAARVIGVAPPVSAEDATRYTCETIDALVALESFDLLCRISVGNVDSKLSGEELRRRVNVFKTGVRDHCETRHVPFGDNSELLGGGQYAYAPDRIHPGLGQRLQEAEAACADIVERLEITAARRSG